jgi:uncharacterized protein YecE (DUF72 family)
MATLYAGTSGFAYPAWRPGFYPAKTPANQFLKVYAERLNCVEINYTFRRLPSASTLENWVAQTPPGFVFAVKANMRITHILLLRAYLELLPGDLRYAFEFRHASWLVEEVYDVLRERNVSLCVAESERLEVPQVITADFVYYRLRKPEYTADDVAAIVARSKEALATGRDLYLMFKHEESPEGALHAETILRGLQ